MENKNTLSYIIIGILMTLCLGLAIWLYTMNNNIDKLEQRIFEQESSISVEQEHIKDLMIELDTVRSRNNELLDSIKTIKTKVIIKEVEKIKYLPLDSNVKLLSDNLNKYGEFTTPEDTLPGLLAVNQKDTVVAISENNVKDINSIVVKYELGVAENDLLYEVIKNDSIALGIKDSIILDKDVIISKQDSIFDINMKRLEKQIKRDKVISGTLGATVGAAVVTAIVLGVTLGK